MYLYSHSQKDKHAVVLHGNVYYHAYTLPSVTMFPTLRTTIEK